MKKTFLMIGAVSMIALGACQQTTGNKQTIGAASGAVLGGLAGSQVGGGSGRLIATAAGAVGGLFLGSEIGKSLDKADRAYAQQSLSQAHSAPIGERISWNNSQTGNYGYTTPIDDGYSNTGNYCRKYEQTIYVDGQAQTGTGTACQQPDGTWQLVQ